MRELTVVSSYVNLNLILHSNGRYGDMTNLKINEKIETTTCFAHPGCDFEQFQI